MCLCSKELAELFIISTNWMLGPNIHKEVTSTVTKAVPEPILYMLLFHRPCHNYYFVVLTPIQCSEVRSYKEGLKPVTLLC